LEALASLLDASLDGIVVVDEERRFIYANPAACRLSGYTVDELIGQDFLRYFPEREHPAMIEHFRESIAGQPGTWPSTIIHASGEERDIEYSNMALTVEGRLCGAAIFRDVTDTRRLEREGAALTAIASQVAFGGTMEATVALLCRRLVEASGTVASAVSLVDPDTNKTRMVGTYGHPDGYAEAINAIIDSGAEIPSTMALAERRTIVLQNGRRHVLEMPQFAVIHPFLRDAGWESYVAVPMLYHDRPVGVLIGYYPQDHDLGENDIKFLNALANQAAIAFENARLIAQAHDKAAMEERARLARELHDSVTQALFSMNLTTRSAEVLLNRPDVDHAELKQKLWDLRQLTQGALAEMRALIFELRPGALEEEGLVQALRKHAAAVQGRRLLHVEVHLDGEQEPPRLRPAAEEALYRIAQEALHNVVKHAKASAAEIGIGADDRHVILTVTDNGVGFDPEHVPAGHMGLENMCQRAEALGGSCDVQSAPGKGTTLTVQLPLEEYALHRKDEG
jgi:PAS domain S-box-containing protein